MRTTPASWSTSMETAPERFMTSWMFLPPLPMRTLLARSSGAATISSLTSNMFLALRTSTGSVPTMRTTHASLSTTTLSILHRSCAIRILLPLAPTTIPMNLGSTSNSTLRPRSSSSCTLARSWSSFSLMDNRCCSTILRSKTDSTSSAARSTSSGRSPWRTIRSRRASSKVTSPMPTAAPWMSSIPSGECAHCTSEDGREKSRDSA
mmetsp:Transcript_56/g.269  ORF Transcript_56/g.269 Transcript_56/m.269 type:complete len:207 (-) Transcript_56:209-829(-)